MVTAGGNTYTRNAFSQAVITGTFSMCLIPNDAVTPSGTSYTFQFVPSLGSAWSTYCTVPTSVSPIRFSALTCGPNLPLVNASFLSTKGDILGYGTQPMRVPIGANGTVPTADASQSAGWAWKTLPTILGYTPESQLTFTSPLIRSTNTITCQTASASQPGCQSAADWINFNSKQAALGYTAANAANFTNVENTALSTWPGSGNITTLGTITAGTIPVARISGLGTSATHPATDFEVPLTFSTGLNRTANTISIPSGGVVDSMLTSGITPSKVGNNVAQWNANQLQGRTIVATAPTIDGQYYAWNLGLSQWEPRTLPVAGVSHVFTRAGDVTAQTGDYTAAQVTNAVDSTGTYANPSWLTSLAWTKLTGVPASEVPLTFTSPLIRTLNTIACQAATGSLPGCLAAADWTTFNGKQPALGFTAENAANKDAASGYAGLTAGGLLKIAEAPTWNQSTTGNATTATTATNFSGSLVGDVSGTQGATVVTKINGISLAGLGTGILRNTTGTGAPSIAIAADFPTLNQSTTGNSTTATTAVSFSGSLVGDASGTQAATVVTKINGVSLAGLGTGILKNTTATGLPSIAVPSDFPTLNQSTTGNAATATALAATPTKCAAGNYPLGISATGNALNCTATGIGTVTSVGFSGLAWLSVSGSPITSSGSIGITAAAGQTPGQVIGTCGSATSFAPCALVPSDIPILNQSTTANAGTVTGLSIASGKTLTANNTLTFAGVDGSTLYIGSGGALGTSAYTAASSYEVPLTFSTGLSRIGNTITATTIPAGSSSWVQWNNSGALGADSGFTYLSGSATLSTSVKAPLFTSASALAIKPGVDSTSAVQIQTSGGSAVATIDTTNQRVGIGITPSFGKLEVLAGPADFGLNLTGTAPAAVSSGAGVNAKKILAVLGPKGGNTSDTSSTYAAGNGAIVQIVAGGGGDFTGVGSAGNSAGVGGSLLLSAGPGGQATAVTGSAISNAGGLVQITAGPGGGNLINGANGGSGAGLTLGPGAGGGGLASGSAGGATLSGGSGGGAIGTTNGGSGGSHLIQGGSGGSANSGNGGNGGDVTLEAGTGASSASGSPGVNGQITIGFVNARAISIGRSGITTTIFGHTSFEGVTSTGATGTGNLVYSASPTFTGTLTAAGATIGGALTTSITGGGIQCTHVNNLGVLTGTGSDCGAGGGGGVSMFAQLGDMQMVRTGAFTVTIGANCSSLLPCNERFGSTVYSFTAGATATISAGTGVAYMYVTSAGVLTVGHVLTVGCAGCIATAGVTAFPTDSIPIGTWSATSGSWDATGGIEKRAAQATKVVLAGTGLLATEIGGATQLSLDPTIAVARVATIDAAGCGAGFIAGSSWDLPPTNAPTPTCYGTSYKFASLDFPDSANTSAFFSFVLPPGWTGNTDIDLFAFSSGTSQAYKATLATVCLKTSADILNPTFNATQTVSVTSPATAFQSFKLTQLAVTTFGCSAGDRLLVKTGRDTTDGSVLGLSVVSAAVTIRVVPQP